MGIRKGNGSDFYARSPEFEEVSRERKRWLTESPELYMGLEPESDSLLAETAQLLKAPPDDPNNPTTLFHLGTSLEPDFVLLRKEGDQFILTGGVVCFPSFWSMPEKIGMPVEKIHSIVPTLNPTLGRSIQQFLQRLQPEISWERLNWGLAATKEKNCHPTLHRRRLEGDFQLSDVYLRTEHQSFMLLPSGALLFGIRVLTEPLQSVLSPPEEKEGFITTLQTMPAEVAEYKGLLRGRDRLLGLLRATT